MATRKGSESPSPAPEPLVGSGLGQVAYDAYSASVGGKSAVSGAKLPAWDDQAHDIAAAWCAAAQAVIAATFGGK